MLELTCRSAFEAYWAHQVRDLEQELSVLRVDLKHADETIRCQRQDIYYLEKSCEMYHFAITSFLD